MLVRLAVLKASGIRFRAGRVGVRVEGGPGGKLLFPTRATRRPLEQERLCNVPSPQVSHGVNFGFGFASLRMLDIRTYASSQGLGGTLRNVAH